MNQDGVKNGYDCRQLAEVRNICDIPLIASGGAGRPVHFLDVFDKARVDGALAASVFHNSEIDIGELKQFLAESNVDVRMH